MPFQFLCPQGHLLQADEAHMGLQTQCPQCGVLFIIPTIAPTSYVAETNPAVTPYPGAGAPHEAPASFSSPQDYLGAIGSAPTEHVPAAGDSSAESTGQPAPVPKIEAEPTILHIPCPNGHELETPVEMLGQDVLCPHCGAQFHLRQEDSIEAQRERELRELRRGEAWFRWSIAAAVIVLVGLLAMIIIANRG
jgi:hypothetical protein